MAEILVIDDQNRYVDLCRKAMPAHRWHGPVRSFGEAATWLSEPRRADLVLLDVHFDIPAADLLGVREGIDARALERLKRTQGLLILGALRERWPNLPVIVMTSRDEVELSDAGAEEFTYFLDHDEIDARGLSAQIEGILAARRGEEADGPVFWGRSLPMRRIRHQLGVLARGRLPVVLLGPTGSGKSLIARHFVHERSGRKGAFIAVDLSTVPRELMAAHLFGSAKGSFTGSVSDKIGAFEAADRGTLFLDEVGNLSLDAQKMLLTVLQEGRITRIGDVKERVIDVKLVVATHEDLRARVREGTFRADLHMRLNPAAAVSLPALRDRALDLDRLLEFALGQALERPYLRELIDDYRERHHLGAGRTEILAGSSIPETTGTTLYLLFPERSMRLLRAYPWPGNLREFAMTVENAALFALSEMIGVDGGDRPDVLQVRPKLIRDLLEEEPEVSDLREPAVIAEGDAIAIQLSPQATLNQVAVEAERQYFTALFHRHNGDFGDMAKALLGDSSHGRKVQLRFNQLGLKVRELKDSAPQ